MSAKPKPNPASPSPERKWVDYETPRYLAELLRDYKDNIAIHKLWEKLERILMATQWEIDDPAVCKAVKILANNLKMFADQGKLDLEYIKTLPPAP